MDFRYATKNSVWKIQKMCSLSMFLFTVVCWQWTLLPEILSAVIKKNVDDVRLGFPFLVTAVEGLLFCPTQWTS